MGANMLIHTRCGGVMEPPDEQGNIKCAKCGKVISRRISRK
ncbi:MAG TPA: hypothetical protein PKA28_11200 [Methylomusa anaerophila]|uniref:Uncharacterized protein n=1 Tax=Methylomusa anaerophila TaxID=1930071 RepID=A0A348AJ77_9FIRM|nr:hypothetical protein MAMMFC1_01794 [Methylomusa anaerophila]HML89002.1 hypothetical protein [Methylomusa anaerophila]